MKKTNTKVFFTIQAITSLWLTFLFIDEYFFHNSWYSTVRGPYYLVLGLIFLSCFVVNAFLFYKEKNKAVMIFSIITLLIMFLAPMPQFSFVVSGLKRGAITAKGAWIKSGAMGYKGTCPDGYEWKVVNDGINVDSRPCEEIEEIVY